MRTIKELLDDDSGVNIVCGAANAMIAKLAENAGFDGVWLSSFEMHAWDRLPDASILNTTDYATAVSKMCDRVDIPILVDSDEGGPSAVNTIRMAREYSKAGAWAMCIEDNTSPKRCSFYGMEIELEKPEVMCGKIRAIKDKNNKPGFAVIARTEALIQKRGHDVALERARMYNDAGCDGFLIHSKSPDSGEVLKFAEMYHGANLRAPLVCVPTTYNKLTTQEMHDSGFSLAIYANYSIRATVKILERMFTAMVDQGTLSAGNGDVCPMTDIFELIWVEEMKENQKRYGS